MDLILHQLLQLGRLRLPPLALTLPQDAIPQLVDLPSTALMPQQVAPLPLLVVLLLLRVD